MTGFCTLKHYTESSITIFLGGEGLYCVVSLSHCALQSLVCRAHGPVGLSLGRNHVNAGIQSECPAVTQGNRNGGPSLDLSTSDSESPRRPWTMPGKAHWTRQQRSWPSRALRPEVTHLTEASVSSSVKWRWNYSCIIAWSHTGLKEIINIQKA